MKSLLLSLTAYTVVATINFALVSPVHANSKTGANDKTVTSKEFRYDKPYTASPSLLPKTTSLIESEESKEQPLSSASSQQVNTNKHQHHVGVSKSSSDILVSSINEFWIYESWITLEQDIDYDGYHSAFSIEFDADTIFTRAPVYAVLYLGRNGVYEAIHVSSEFYIYSEDSTDTFTIESTLLTGYPSSEYDVLLELYDADTEVLVAFTDAFDDSALSYLPLESENNEYVVEETVVVVEEHGGTWSWLSLFMMGGVVLFRQKDKRNER
ncbi:choice-of-anchor H family protein [Alteromonas gracilis]|uniref:choice-of-anchor H family protein n=1 Tax=Alteromonas gracilis TaxID=1479524 RepID=UPI003736CF5C